MKADETARFFPPFPRMLSASNDPFFINRLVYTDPLMRAWLASPHDITVQKTKCKCGNACTEIMHRKARCACDACACLQAHLRIHMPVSPGEYKV
jgi:hypothetical protein